MGAPGQGDYCSTKHALEAYADSLYLELAQFYIRVSIVEPGSYRTGILARPVSSTMGAATVGRTTTTRRHGTRPRANGRGGLPVTAE